MENATLRCPGNTANILETNESRTADAELLQMLPAYQYGRPLIHQRGTQEQKKANAPLENEQVLKLLDQ